MMTSLGSGSAATRVEKATSHLLNGPDWALNLDICDMINMDRWQTKEVVKAIKKRLQNKHPKVQFLTLMLLETMMKNCGDSVRFEVSQQEILQEMTKIVKKQSDFQVRDKALILLDSWQEAFGGPGTQYPQYYWAYIELKRSGVQFPRRAPDAPLTFTNATSAATSASSPRYNSSNYASNYQNPNLNNERPPSNIFHMGVTELNNIRGVMDLLSEMLREINPRDRMAIKDEIITDLVTQCRSNQKKIIELINSTGDESLLADALTLNDNLQNVLEKHDAIASGKIPSQLQQSSPVVQSSPVQGSSPVVQSPPVMSAPPVVEEEDDEFAELARRKSKGKTIEQEPSSSSSNHTEESVISNALVPITPEPSKQQDMIDLLTLALYDNPQSQTQSQSQSQSESESQFSFSSDPNALSLVPISVSSSPPPSPPQPYNYNPYNQPYNPNPNPYNPVPYNGYVASWAQPPPQPQPQFYNYNYPPSNYSYPNPTPQVSQTPVNTINNPVTYSNPSQPMQRMNSFGATNNNIPVASVSSQMGRLGSFGNNSTGGPALKKEMPNPPKPYYMPDNLFGDLVDLKGFGNKKGAGSGGGSGQSMINGKK